MENDTTLNGNGLQKVKASLLGWWVAGFVILAIGGWYYFSHQEVPVTRNDCIAAEQAESNMGKKTCVKVKISYTYVSSAGNAFLDQYQNYSSGFAAWIPSSESFGNDMASKYLNKTIYVSGTITSYKGAPQIEVTDASQVQLAQ